MSDYDDFAADPFDDEPPPYTNGHGNGKDHAGEARWAFNVVPNLDWWLDRELLPRDCLLGEIIATSSRVMLVAPTGLGKTNFGLGAAIALATGYDFLHWHVPRPVRVLYIDGEMPARLIKRRLADAVRRNGAKSNNFVLLSREDFPDMPPLNTLEGQAYVEDFIAWAGIPDELGERGFDIIIFDNIQALLRGDLKEPSHWQPMLDWTGTLTGRNIAQLWIHHTGHDETRSYGDKTRDWQFETTMMLERVELPGVDIAFKLTFPKARERTPENRGDFDEATITLVNDGWTSDRDLATRSHSRKRTIEDIALDALDEAILKAGTTPADHRVPTGKFAVTRDLWRRYFRQIYVGGGDEKSVDREFRRLAAKLQAGQRIRFEDPWIWRV